MPFDLLDVLVVVESPVKALALLAAGINAVGLGGTGTTLTTVTGERRLNDSWSTVPVEGRRAIILFDAGVDWNPCVARDAARLAMALRLRGADVYLARLPAAGPRRDQGPDDFIAAHGVPAVWRVLSDAVPASPLARVKFDAASVLLRDLQFRIAVLEDTVADQLAVRAEMVKAVKAADWKAALREAAEHLKQAHNGKAAGGFGGPRYSINAGCFAEADDDGDDRPLCNFTASIVQEVIQDNGVDESRVLTIQGRLNTGEALLPVELEIGELDDSLWPLKAWGPRAQVSPDAGTAGHLLLAVQQHSSPGRRRLHTHTGWRYARDDTGAESGHPIYLHAGGAVGVEDIAVHMEGALSRYRLPGASIDSAGAVRSSLALLEIAPKNVSWPLLASVYRGPLQSILYADFSLFLVGQSGSMKTTLATLSSAHYGEALAERPAASFVDSIAALEAKLFALKDAPVVIDDFKPKTPHPKDEMRVKAHAVFSSVGNGEGRGRMKSDGSARPERPPRALVIATGEVLPDGESTLARILPVELPRGTVNIEALTRAQADAGRLQHALVAYLEWLRPRYDGLRRSLPGRFREWREVFRRDGGHLRAPAQLAHLAVAIELLGEFIKDIGGYDGAAAAALVTQGIGVLKALGTTQVERAQSADPVIRFLEVLKDLIHQGKLLLEIDREKPLCSTREKDAPIGEYIGWDCAVNTGSQARRTLWLLPDAMYREVVHAMQRAGEPMPLSRTALLQRLRDSGRTEKGDREGHLTKRVTAANRRIDVVVTTWKKLFGTDDAPTPAPEPDGTDDGSPGDESELPDDPMLGNDERSGTPATDSSDRTSFESNRTSPAAERTSRTQSYSTELTNNNRETSSTTTPSGPVGPAGRKTKSPPAENLKATECGAEQVTLRSGEPPAISGGAGPTGPTALNLAPIQAHYRAEPPARTGPTDHAPGEFASANNQLVAVAAHWWRGRWVLASMPSKENNCAEPPATLVAADALTLFRTVEAYEIVSPALRCIATARRLLGRQARAEEREASPTDRESLPTHWAALERELSSAGLAGTAELEFDLLPVVAAMEKAGVGVDVAAWSELVHQAEAHTAEQRAALTALGLSEPYDDAQVRAALRARGLSAASTSWKALAAHMGDPLVAALIGYRRSAGFLNSTGRVVLEAAQRGTGRVHPKFDPMAAPTGRMSCSRPNLLSIPKSSAYRGCFVPAPGHLFVVGDYAAIELRVLAELTQDAALTKVFAEGGDPHTATAAALLGKPVGDVTKNERQRAKAVNFGFAFGMGPSKFVEYAYGNFGLAFTGDEAAKMRAAFLHAYPGIAAWQRRTRQQMPLEVRTGSGRRRVFASKSAEYCERLNTPVQGTAADGLKSAMVCLHRRLADSRARLVLAVHDEILVEVPNAAAQDVRAVLQEAMVEGMARFVPTVPVAVSTSIRRTWAEENS